MPLSLYTLSRIAGTSVVVTTLLFGACASDFTDGDETTDSIGAISAALAAEDDSRGDRRARLATRAAHLASRFPTLPLQSDHPLDIAVSDTLGDAVAFLGRMAEAEVLTAGEIRQSARHFVSVVGEDAVLVEGLLDTASGSGIGHESDTVSDPSCSKRCLDEFKECIEPFRGSGDWHDVPEAALCSMVFEICLVDCLLPG